MEKNGSKNILFGILACCLIVVVIVLVVIIIKINKEENSNRLETVNTSSNADENESVNSSESATEGNNSDTLVNKPNSEAENKNPNVYTDNSNMTETIGTDKEDIRVTLGTYKGIKVDYSPVIITDADIDRRLNQIKNELTVTVDMPDRPFENGDMAIVTYKGSVDGVVIDDFYVVCLQVVLGNGTMPEVFENEVIGRRKGDSFSVELDYPADYYLEAAAGKTVHFDVDIVDGFVFDIPEINDELINEVTDYSSVDEFRTKTKEALQKEQDDIAYEISLEKLKNMVVENCSYSGPIDEEIKKQYVLRLAAENSEYMENYLMDAATYHEIVDGITATEYNAALLAQVTTEVKYNLALDAIAVKEGLDKTNPEADEITLREMVNKLIVDSADIEGLVR